MGIYLPPFDFMYAFVSLVAALTHGLAAVPFGFVTAWSQNPYVYEQKTNELKIEKRDKVDVRREEKTDEWEGRDNG